MLDNGSYGDSRADGTVSYDTGVLQRGFLAVDNGGSAITVDTTAFAAIDVLITWATASASNTVTVTHVRIEALN